MMKQKMTRNPVPFSVLFGSSSVITKHLKAVPETQRKITVYLNEFEIFEIPVLLSSSTILVEKYIRNGMLIEMEVLN